jgi:hypothetical protein
MIKYKPIFLALTIIFISFDSEANQFIGQQDPIIFIHNFAFFH